MNTEQSSLKPNDEKRLVSLEHKLRTLRRQHTDLAQEEKWTEAQTSRDKIIALLNQITREFPEWREQSFALIDRPEEMPLPMSGVQQEPIRTDSERLARLPDVLRAYAKDIDKHGAPLDSGLPEILRFIAGQIPSVNHAARLAEALRETTDALYNETYHDPRTGKSDSPWIASVKAKAREALAAWEGAK